MHGATPNNFRQRFEAQRNLKPGADAIAGRKSHATIYCFAPRQALDAAGNRLSERKLTQLRRRLHLLGESLESGQVWDICQAFRAITALEGDKETKIEANARGLTAVNAVYASLFVPGIARLNLFGMPASHRDGPIYLNVLRHLDLPQAMAMAAERTDLSVAGGSAQQWEYATQLIAGRGWNPQRLQFVGGNLPSAPPSAQTP
jgi:hypothetical protein